LCGQLAPERVGLDVVDERPHAVDLDHGKPLPVARLELGVAPDVNLLQLEAELLAQGRDLRTRTLAEVASLRVVEDDARATDRCRG
jgi:hypothetical protein